MTPEQMIAWMLIEGWIPQDMGTGAFNPNTLMYVNSTHHSRCKEDGRFATGDYDWHKFDPEHIQGIYDYIRKAGL